MFCALFDIYMEMLIPVRKTLYCNEHVYTCHKSTQECENNFYQSTTRPDIQINMGINS